MISSTAAGTSGRFAEARGIGSSACLRMISYSLSASKGTSPTSRSEEHTSELQSPCNLVCRLLLEKKKYDQGLVDRIKQYLETVWKDESTLALLYTAIQQTALTLKSVSQTIVNLLNHDNEGESHI